MNTFTLLFLAGFASQLAFSQENLKEAEHLISIARQVVKVPESPEKLIAAASLELENGPSFAADDEATDSNGKLWVQHGLAVTNDSLDIGIQGQGFFWLINPVTGELRVTRNGVLKIDTTGHLVHWENGDRFMKYTDAGYSDIKITDFAKYFDSHTNTEIRVSRFEVKPDAKIIAVYENGEHRLVAKLAVVDIGNPRKLKRLGQHIFLPTSESGLPQMDKASVVYGASREVLDEEAYSRNLVTDQK